MSRTRPLALTQQRRRERPVPLPVSPTEMDTCRALERQGVPRELVLRVVLPLSRAGRVTRSREGDALIRYLLEKSTTGGT